MHPKFQLAIFLVLGLLSSSLAASSCDSSKEWINSTAPSSFSELDITYPLSFISSNVNVSVVYYVSTTGNIDVDIVGCSDVPNDGIIGTLEASLTAGTKSILLALSNKQEGTVTGHVTSSAVRTTIPLSLLAAALSFLIFPKNKSMILLLAVIGIVLYAPLSSAASGPSITIRVGIPSKITSVCVNGVCGNSTGGSMSFPTGPTSAPPVTAYSFNLRVLVISAYPLTSYGSQSTVQPAALGGDFVALAFNSLGMPYDYLVVTPSTDLSSKLSTAGIGAYSAIVTIGDTILNGDQSKLISLYQQKYGVRMAVVGSTGNTLTGVQMGSVISNTAFTVSLNTAFNAANPSYAKALNPSINIANDYANNWSGFKGIKAKLYPCTITDTTNVQPVLMANLATGSYPAVIEVTSSDKTKQLHYFVDQTAEYIHSMAFASVFVNWLAPGGVFIGARRLTLSVQPDDLFLGSFIWNITTHTNPITAGSPWYRMSADDLQNLANFFDTLNPRLPAGSSVTVEWPTNFGGINGYYTAGQTDELYLKALQLMDKFYYLSHTWDHPCTFDTLDTATGYSTMYNEVAQNIAYGPIFFGDKSNLWSSAAMITPCVTGLYNSGALQAMLENGITACVSDESISNTTVDFEPKNAYHGIWSTVERNGIEGMYFVPREALDIDYCAVDDAMVVDEYNTNTPPAAGADPLSFEDIMTIQRLYGVQDMISFRHDPFMMHQTNAATFTFADTLKGTTYNTSLIALFIERVLDEVITYYNLPIITPQMDTIVDMFKQRDAMDSCGMTTTLGVNAKGQIVDVSVVGSATCQVSISGVTLSGSTVTMETYGPETTAWVNVAGGSAAQLFTLATPITM